jgi:hypothetical protein
MRATIGETHVFRKYEPAPAEGPHRGELAQEFDKATPPVANGISSLICIARTETYAQDDWEITINWAVTSKTEQIC